MTQPFRLPEGGRIDRTSPAGFTFDGQPLTGFAGDTLASALLANGIHLVGRSFKYHRPRGILSAGAEEPNALVTVGRGPGRVTPNLRATQIALYPGLIAHSQNRYPSLRHDLGAVAGLAAPLLGAGFYYKTFMWPAGLWKRLYEPAIRAAAGLGRAPTTADPDRYLHQYAHCDVLVIGAGPAGLAAALGAASTGARVILCDEAEEPGGSLRSSPTTTIDGWPAADWLRTVTDNLARAVTFLPRTTAFGWYPDNLIGLVERVTDHLADPAPDLPRERLWQVRAKRVVIATGAIERPLVFPGNDRPGILLAGAARDYLTRHAVIPGRRAVVATACDSAYRAALDLHAAGVEIAAILDRRPSPSGPLADAARAAGIPVHPDTAIRATRGRLRVRGVSATGGVGRIRCDTVLISGGWTPSVHLHAQSRGRLRYDPASGTFLPAETTADAVSVGACAGTFDLGECLAQGFAAGAGTARHFIIRGADPAPRPAPPRPAAPHRKAFVDFQNDVTTRDLAIAAQEGFRAVEHAKRYTTAGMATDQGKTANLNAIATLAELTDTAPPDLGTTTFRPPYTPVTFGALAGTARGALFDPVRHPPTHAWASAQGALFEDVGTWKRALCFPAPGETPAQAVARECLAVRRAVGLFDASTLGKIEVTGPDAAAFLDRIYPAAVASLPVGRCRYSLLLGEDGFIRDDGVIARLAPDRFHVTTTTGGAAAVLHLLEDYLQTEFTGLDAWLTSTTEQWGVIAIQGPAAASVLAPLLADIDLGTLPHMGAAEGYVRGIPCRLFRVSFTGELGYEINVPAGWTQAVWDTILAAGAPFGITPYGTEAMHVLRAEVGYVIVGQETDGTVIPDDLDLGRTIARSKRDFVGRRSLFRPDMRRPGRKQLVGLLPRDHALVPEEGAQVLLAPGASPALGHVTSAYPSATLGRAIALALVEDGRARIGQVLYVTTAAQPTAVEVVEPRFIPGGLHQPGGSPILPADPPPTLPPMPADEAPALPTALRAASAPSRHVRLRALTPTIRLSVRAGREAAATLSPALGVSLEPAILRASLARGRAALALGPDEWLVLAPTTDQAMLAQALPRATEAGASVVDISHRHAAIEISGPRAAFCLNAFCALDLHPSAFPIGMCTRTLLGKAEIVLWRVGAETFHLETARSLAPYVWQCLEEARREFRDPTSG